MNFAGFAGGWEWVIIVLAILVLFGAKKIPEFAKGLGKGVKEFKKAKDDIETSLEDNKDNSQRDFKADNIIFYLIALIYYSMNL